MSEAPAFHLRRLEPSDDLEALTGLLHRAYGPLAASGMQYWASHQSVDDTRARTARGEAWVAVARDGAIVGTATLVPPGRTKGCAYYERTDLATLHQLAVEPSWQGQGVARALHGVVRARAARLGAVELALDTAASATELQATYARWGYRRVGAADWRPAVNYPSVLLGLALTPPAPVEIHAPDPALDADAFLDLTQRVWPGRYDRDRVAEALGRTINVTARRGALVVGSLRLLTDGYFFGTIPEVLVDPVEQGLGVGRALVTRGREISPTGLWFGAQPGREGFYEKLGFEPGLVGFSRRKGRG